MTNMQSNSVSYKDSGVDTTAGQNFVKSISQAVSQTHNKHVFKDKAGFAGLMDVSFLTKYKQPLLVSATDGVGTKLHLARLFDRHETVGIDLVAMCVNDLLATGAQSLQFLDYIACGKLNPSKMLAIVEGISKGCILSDCVLAGGETAEHPDTMHADEYDLAGFVVGVVEAEKRITGENVKEGDVLIALPSSGIHANGMSLVRRLFLEDGLNLPDDNETKNFLLNQILLKPTIIYEKALRPILEKYGKSIHGISHITGGGYDENIPRILPKNLCAQIDLQSYTIPDVFKKIQSAGVEQPEMFKVFNMGSGMIIAVDSEQAKTILQDLESSLNWKSAGALLAPWVIGNIIKQEKNKQVVFTK